MNDPQPLASSFGNRLKYFRLLRGLTQNDLAATIGLSVKQYGRIERGAASPPLAVVERLAEALKTVPFNLFLHDFPQPLDVHDTDAIRAACLPPGRLLCPSVRLAAWSLDGPCQPAAWSGSLYAMLGYAPLAVRPTLKRFLRHVDSAQSVAVASFFVAAKRMDDSGDQPGPSMLIHVTTRDNRQKTILLAALTLSDEARNGSKECPVLDARMIILLDVTECLALNRALACNQNELEAYVLKRNKELARAVTQYEQEAAQRIKTEQELRIFERMVHYSLDAQAYIDAAGVIRAVNTAYEGRSGLVRTRLSGRHYLEVMTERWGRRFVEQTVAPRLTNALAGMASSYRQWLDYPARGRRFIHVAYSPCFEDLDNLESPQAAVVGTVVTIHDLTEQEQARQNTERYKFAVDSSLAAMVMADTNMILTHVNPAFLECWGYASEDEILGRHASEFHCPLAPVDQAIAALHDTGRWQGMLRCKRKDGSLFTARTLTSAMRDGTGCLVGFTASFLAETSP